MSNLPTQCPQLVDSRHVAAMLNLSVRTLWRLMKLRGFPQPIRVGSRSIRWRLSDIAEYVRLLPPASPAAHAGRAHAVQMKLMAMPAHQGCDQAAVHA